MQHSWLESTPMQMAPFGDGWEGRVIEGRFPLLKWMGGTENSALYFTVLQGMQEAIIQLISTDDAQADMDIAQWTFAQSLSHPNLVKVFAAGRCVIDETTLVYVVGERSSTNLAKMIESERLAADQAKEIFNPIVDALKYLHDNGVVHGHLNPSNIHFAVSKPRLLLTDLLVAGTVRRSITAAGNYDAPELRHGEATAAADVWSLGLTMWEAMTATPPSWDLWRDQEPDVPASLPHPFREVVQGCLRLDPRRRCTLETVQERLSASSEAPVLGASALDEPVPVTMPVQIPLQVPVQNPIEASEAGVGDRPAVHAAVPEEIETEEAYERTLFSGTLSHFDETHEPRSRWVPFVLVLLVVMAIGGFVWVREYKAETFSKLMESATAKIAPSQKQEPASAPAGGDQTEPVQSQPAQTPPAPAQPAPAQPEETQPAPTQPITGSQEKGKQAPTEQPSSKPPTQGDETSQTEAHGAPTANAPVTEEPAPPSRVHREENGRGQVERRVMPTVSPGARSAMSRPVQVLIRVTVNRHGTVSDASYVAPGPGNYFARQAQKAAQSWKFKPPVQNGDAESSVWMLKFNFRRAGIEATATEQKD